MNYKFLLVVVIVLAAVVGIQFLVYGITIGGELVWEGTATVAGWDEKESMVKMLLDCDGKEGYTTDEDIIINYLNDPRPLENCRLYRSGKIKVDLGE